MLKTCKRYGIRYDSRIKLLQVFLVGILVFILTGKKIENEKYRISIPLIAS